MELELQYVAELEKRGLQVKDLPEDAKTGVKEINKALSFIKMNEGKGKKTSPDAIKKIKAMDKWVLYEIYDMESGEDKNEDEIPYESEDIKDDLDEDENEPKKFEADGNEKNQPAKQVQSNVDGSKVDLELDGMYKSGKSDWTIGEIKNTAKNAYNAIFDVYDENEENGIKTTNYSLLETEEQKYKLTKI
jgi:hypothetical protein